MAMVSDELPGIDLAADYVSRSWKLWLMRAARKSPHRSLPPRPELLPIAATRQSAQLCWDAPASYWRAYFLFLEDISACVTYRLNRTLKALDKRLHFCCASDKIFLL
jgi:hypothetical protein